MTNLQIISQETIIIIAVCLLFLWAIMGFPSVFAESKIYHQEKFCNLEKYYGFDCMTVIIWYDNTVPCISVKNAYGCATFYQNTILISIAHPEVFYHEIKHLTCQCNFHEGMDN